MRQIMKLLFFISKKRINKKGLAPIYCRITINGMRSEISTGVFVNPSFFVNEKLTETSQENTLWNAHLAKIKSDISAIYVDLCLKGKIINPILIRDLYTGKHKLHLTLTELINAYVTHKESVITEQNTLKTYRARKNQILNWLQVTKQTNIYPNEFTHKKIESYMFYLQHTQKLSVNYINKCVMFLKSIYIYAIANGYVTTNPISTVRLKHEKPKEIISLSKPELAKLLRYKFASVRLQHVADMYIFQAYTGFAYADLFDFCYQKHVRKVNSKFWIFKKRVKVDDAEAIIPLFPEAINILNKYNNKLPVISNQRYNSYLKEIVEILGIEKNLTTHTARKTFAMIKLNDGYSLESVAKMLGHTSVKITQNTYATVGTLRIEGEMQRLGIGL